MGLGSGRGGRVEADLMLMRWRMGAMEQELAKPRKRGSPGEVCALAAERMQLGLSLDREQTAAILGVSTKKLQRMEARGELRRCSDISGVVRYPASDVQRLASAR